MRTPALKFLFIVVSCFPVAVSLAQENKKNWIISGGLQQVNSKGIYHAFVFDEGGTIDRQSSATLFDASMQCLFHPYSDVKRLGFIFGAGFNQKGYTQSGSASTGASEFVDFTYTLALTYLDIHAGVTFDAVDNKKYRLSIGQLLHPEVLLLSQFGSRFNNFPVSTRTFIAADIFVTQRLGVRVSPFFQTSLVNYNLAKPLPGYSNFRPYSFGLTAGLVF